MSTDWREKEREFLTSLKADTGRDLAEWVRVIAAQNLPHRNDIIDWLRQQGFLFARASWLERIHHNQGRPIYLDPAELMPAPVESEAEIEVALQRVAVGGSRLAFVAAPSTTPPVAPAKEPTPQRTMPLPRIAAESPRPIVPASDTSVGPADNPAIAAAVDAGPSTAIDGASATALKTGSSDAMNAPPSGTISFDVELPAERDFTAAAAVLPVVAPQIPSATPSATPALTPTRAPAPAGSLDTVIAKAKAYRPLALHLIRMIEGAVPDLEIVPGPSHLFLLRDGKAFGLIAISSKDIRLALSLNPEVACAPFGPVKLPSTLSRTAQGMTHMVVLTDARQLDEALINLVGKAAGR